MREGQTNVFIHDDFGSPSLFFSFSLLNQKHDVGAESRFKKIFVDHMEIMRLEPFRNKPL